MFTETHTGKILWLSYLAAIYEAFSLACLCVCACLCRTPKEMLEKIAELDYSQSQLRELNTEMRHWLDVADDDMAVLRSDNTALRKQVKV